MILERFRIVISFHGFDNPLLFVEDFLYRLRLPVAKFSIITRPHRASGTPRASRASCR